MIISINGKGMEVSEYLEDVVQKRVSKLSKYLREDAQVQVMLSMFRGRQVAELTVPVGTTIVRAEEATGDMYASIDNATKSLERQIIRYRTRMDRRMKEQSIRHDMPILPAFEEEEEDEEMPKVVRVKRFSLRPMTVEEAIEQMEMLGHTFFVFCAAETGEVNVLYRRNDGQLGLIEPELD